jgi:hypothetical protein
MICTESALQLVAQSARRSSPLVDEFAGAFDETIGVHHQQVARTARRANRNNLVSRDTARDDGQVSLRRGSRRRVRWRSPEQVLEVRAA